MVMLVPAANPPAPSLEEVAMDHTNNAESPLDVLSRAATMVEAAPTDKDLSQVPRRSNSLKEVHPKFRKHATAASTPVYLAAHNTRKIHRQTASLSSLPSTSSQQQSPEPLNKSATAVPTSESNMAADTPLDFSLKKRTSPSPPPPYKYSNPLRQHSPPPPRPSVSPPLLLTLKPAPYGYPAFNPPPPAYMGRRSPSPPPPARPPPPSYEAAMAAKPISPTTVRAPPPPASSTRAPSSSSTFLNLHPRPTPAFASSPPRSSSPPRLPTSPTACRRIPPPPFGGEPAVVVKKETVSPDQPAKFAVSLENKENHRDGRKITIVEETGLGSLEEHFRKSLGEDYSKLFQNTAKPAPKSDEEAGRKGRQEGATAGRKSRQEETTAEKQEEPKTKESDVVKTIRDDMDTGYTVEDHFAKALGATWTRLQQDKKSKPPIKQELIAS